MTNNIAQVSQPGVLSDPSTFAEYLTFVLKQGSTSDDILEAFSQISGIEKSISQKDPSADLTITVAVSKKAWPMLFVDKPAPKHLSTFPDMQEDNRHFPSTEGDIFFIIKSERMDLNFQVAKYLLSAFRESADLVEDIQGFKYLDNRDLIDFVDGTENPKHQARIDAVLVNDDEDTYRGGSYLTIQRYVDKEREWQRQPIEYQEKVIGRTKLDNIELSDKDKPVWAHNNKSKVIIDEQEIKMLRQNRPFGNALEHGTMFVGFAADPNVIETSLRQMIYADDNGHYDRLLDFVDAKSGCNYFVLSQTLLDSFDDE
ncbi:peroxidase [Vibrio sp. 10N.286.49.C2]|uniref:Dyp-type peroxidase n=1 Tax=unclassified Vibrio TaxID=2614977 RepID=UPI000C84F9A2|nr:MULTISPECIES: Dyp-type peroxidase [unclassified Vibrio]PMH38837.1 peroxidase [Vibrio sp. 10N.286.49.C2]PMH55313.1 peroxidase [Vibrio sp. 10N.286.49.B1]PMH83792.1 peroxidase [Vibrio sp. 10N.286.48.B7]